MKKYRGQFFIPRSTSSEATMSCDEEERWGIPGLNADPSLRLCVSRRTITPIIVNFYYLLSFIPPPPLIMALLF